MEGAPGRTDECAGCGNARQMPVLVCDAGFDTVGLLDKAKSAVKRARGKNLGAWTMGYAGWLARSSLPRARATWAGSGGPRHLLFAFCDHYEPLWRTSDRRLGAASRAAVGRPVPAAGAPIPRRRRAAARATASSFPARSTGPATWTAWRRWPRDGFGEVELHLHHDGDTAAGAARARSPQYLRRCIAGHGHLSRGPDGRLRYAFIHGNWCLANARADGRWCGVDEELPLLLDTGCYADFTFPAAPDESQPAIVNQIYWPEGDLGAAARVRERDAGARRRARRATGS